MLRGDFDSWVQHLREFLKMFNRWSDLILLIHNTILGPQLSINIWIPLFTFRIMHNTCQVLLNVLIREKSPSKRKQAQIYVWFRLQSIFWFVPFNYEWSRCFLHIRPSNTSIWFILQSSEIIKLFSSLYFWFHFKKSDEEKVQTVWNHRFYHWLEQINLSSIDTFLFVG